jgi:hypothetical protein
MLGVPFREAGQAARVRSPPSRNLGLESRQLESRAKALARLDLEVSAGWARPTSRGLWGGSAGAQRRASARANSSSSSSSSTAAGGTLYDVLGVAAGCSVEELKTAFRRKARQQHPDVNKAPDAQVGRPLSRQSLGAVCSASLHASAVGKLFVVPAR